MAYGCGKFKSSRKGVKGTPTTMLYKVIKNNFNTILVDEFKTT